MPGVTLLAGSDDASRIVYHALRSRFDDVAAVIESPVDRTTLARRRMRRYGLRRAVGQVAFVAAVSPLLARGAKARRDEILATHGLQDDPLGEHTRVESVNSEAARAALRRLDPRVVVVNGTRIIGATTLGCVEAPFLNTHAGLTPAFRGVHGGYWALALGRPDLVGTTIHVIDEGIDTGPVLAQATFEVTDRDTFATYPYLHLAAGLPPLLDVVEELLAGRMPSSVPPRTGDLDSQLWVHPGAIEYLMRRWRRGVR